MYHQKDHDFKAEHYFFATSHGKSPCDGIGGTIKLEEAKASLRATTTNHILPPYELFAWAKDNMKGVIMFYVTSDDITNHERRFDLQKCHERLRTIPGTRSYHNFIPDGAKLI